MEEVWLPVKGFEFYEISNHGRLKRVKGSPGHFSGIITHVQICPKGGYPQYRMRLNNKKTARYIHRLVAEHFVDGFRPGLEVNHIDGNKFNNKADNLEWVSRLDNVRHACKTGLVKQYKGDRTGKKFNSWKIVMQFDNSKCIAECICNRVFIRNVYTIANGGSKECRFCSNKKKAQNRSSAKVSFIENQAN